MELREVPAHSTLAEPILPLKASIDTVLTSGTPRICTFLRVVAFSSVPVFLLIFLPLAIELNKLGSLGGIYADFTGSVTLIGGVFICAIQFLSLWFTAEWLEHKTILDRETVRLLRANGDRPAGTTVCETAAKGLCYRVK